MRRPVSRSGFTLLEVLLSLAIFVTAVVVLTASYINILQGLEAVKSDQALKHELRWIRSQIMTQSSLEEVLKGGETEQQHIGKMTWKTEVEPTTVADLFRVSLNVEYADPRVPEKDVEHTEIFFLLRPSWSQPLDRETLRSDAKKRIEAARRLTQK